MHASCESGTRLREGGHQGLGVRWVDVDEADGAHRSRLVAKDINRTKHQSCLRRTAGSDLDVFLALAAQYHEMSIMHIGVKWVDCNHKASRDTHVPIED